ncbi:MAG: M15 family metallopeptidase [Hyphomicrobiaceae bacterium]|nr:M15 family metallopeptidase [Hyphomicrobiaceae bacterium]
MSCTLNARSIQRLDGVHPDLIKVVLRAAELTEVPFQVTEGLRTRQRQLMLVKQGASRTLKSRHLSGHAIDIVAYIDDTTISWDYPLYKTISKAFKQASKELEIPIEWGGDWRSFVDTPHFQLPWTLYPAASGAVPRERTAKDLLAAGSRTVKAARTIRRAGQAAVAVGVATKVIVDDPLGAATTAVNAVGQGREVVTAGREQLTWLLSPGNVSLAIVAVGLVIAAAAAAIIAYRVEDDNTGVHTGRRE